MTKHIKFCVALILHIAVALIGTAILETAIGKVYRPHSLAGVLWKEWLLSLVCAGFIGFLMWRTWRVKAAMWVWVLPTLWFAFRFVSIVLARPNHTVLAGGNIWEQFSGVECGEGLRALGCRNFFVFTIPLVRGVSYSLGAGVSSRLGGTRSHAANEGLSGQSQGAS